ncbi:hypothetical protein H0H93_002073 [Arthromyces matolae]|nr:hypothetical protein H0H93_002073 [Arthromyces matolae]
MRIQWRRLLILASALAILSSATPIQPPNAHSSGGNNQNLVNGEPWTAQLPSGPMANDELSKTMRRSRGRPRKIVTEKEKAQIQKWKEKLRNKGGSHLEAYEKGAERARQQALDTGEDPVEAVHNYDWIRRQRSVQKDKKLKEQNRLKSRIDIDPARIVAWEANMKDPGNEKRHNDAVEEAKRRAEEKGEDPEKAVAKKKAFTYRQHLNRVQKAERKKKANNEHLESVTVQPTPAHHLQDEEHHVFPEDTGEMPMSFEFQSFIDSSDEEDGGTNSNS